MYCSACDTDLPESAFGERPEALSGKRYYCRKCGTKKNVLWRRKKAAAGFCYVCGKRKPRKNKTRCGICIDVSQKRYRKKTPEMHAEQNSRQRAKLALLKQEVYAAYGGYCCACCGETHEAFLTVDHINGDGVSHRKEVGSGGRGGVLYRWLKRNSFPPGFQILCLNCNFALGHKGACPHHPEVKRIIKLRRSKWPSR